MKEFVSYNHQQRLWDAQHARRGSSGQEATILRDVPNDSAVVFAQLLSPRSLILEAGCANGRDARYWATRGHRVIGMDFSQVALDQMQTLARAQGVGERILPVLHDIAEGELPEVAGTVGGFYARSALHVTDRALSRLAHNITRTTGSGGVVLIEGKHISDPKIRRSQQVEKNLYADPAEQMHLRRVWREADLQDLAHEQHWNILDISRSVGESVFVRMVARVTKETYYEK